MKRELAKVIIEAGSQLGYIRYVENPGPADRISHYLNLSLFLVCLLAPAILGWLAH